MNKRNRDNTRNGKAATGEMNQKFQTASGLQQVIIIEDDENLNSMLQDVLGKMGYLVHGYSTASEAFETLRDSPSTILLLDYSLPDMNGDQFIEQLNEAGLKIPFIVITGHGSEKIAVTMMKLGARDYIIKQSNFVKKLLAALEQVKKEIESAEYNRIRQETIKEHEIQFRQLLETANVPIYLRKGNHLVLINRQARELLKIEDEQFASSSPDILRFITEESKSHWMERIRKVMRGETLPPHLMLKARTTTDDLLDLEITETIINLGGEKLVQGFIRDITRQRQLELRIRQATKMEAIGHLSGGVAHDFNNLLTAVTGQAQVAKMKLSQGIPVIQEIEEIEKIAKRASRLTSQLLAFSRQQDREPAIININDVILDIEKMLRRIIGEDVLLSTNLKSELLSVKVDPGQLEQVILNLAVNARDAMPEGGDLLIETSMREIGEDDLFMYTNLVAGSYVVLSVSDNGCGMDRETITHIFEPFFTTKESGKGTGFGLATVYGIVNKSSGEIHVYSEPGKGTIFKIYLPAIEQSPDVTDQVEKVASAKGGNETILLVEDDPQVKLLTAKVLRLKGYQVFTADSGEEALTIFNDRSSDIDLLIADMIMPNMSGKELSEKLKSECKDLKVLFISGYSDRLMSELSQKDINSLFLQKPFSPTGLLQKVRDLLDVDNR